MDENDEVNFSQEIGSTCQLIGECLIVTNKKILKDGIEKK